MFTMLSSFSAEVHQMWHAYDFGVVVIFFPRLWKKNLKPSDAIQWANNEVNLVT